MGGPGPAAAPAVTAKSTTIPTAGGLLYVPQGIDFSRKYPLIIALSPGGDASGAIRPWTAAAARHKWLVYGSLESRNGMDMQTTVDLLASRLDEVARAFPVDRKRVVATGLSGGGMASHAFSFYKPDLVAGVVPNTGMMHDSFQARGASYPRGKFAVFLASPTDFRYKEMQRDQTFLQGLGWKTLWIEFQGGHTMAPDHAYTQAATWIAERFKSL